MSMDSTEKQIGPVVAASHLASGAMPALSEVEFALTMMVNAIIAGSSAAWRPVALKALVHLMSLCCTV